jgi:hypothetical protein
MSFFGFICLDNTSKNVINVSTKMMAKYDTVICHHCHLCLRLPQKKTRACMSKPWLMFLTDLFISLL